MDRGDLMLSQPHRHELGQPPALADDPECAVPGIHQLDGRLDDPPEHHLQLELAADSDHRLQQRLRPVPGVEHRLQPGPELGQQVIEPQVRQQRAGVWVLHSLLLVACHPMIVTSGEAGWPAGPAPPTASRQG